MNIVAIWCSDAHLMFIYRPKNLLLAYIYIHSVWPLISEEINYYTLFPQNNTLYWICRRSMVSGLMEKYTTAAGQMTTKQGTATTGARIENTFIQCIIHYMFWVTQDILMNVIISIHLRVPVFRPSMPLRQQSIGLAPWRCAEPASTVYIVYTSKVMGKHFA